MGKRKRMCSKCKRDVLPDYYEIRFWKCPEGHWHVENVSIYMAMAASEGGLDLEGVEESKAFADKIDKMLKETKNDDHLTTKED